jgi:hypothetical protein
MGMMKSNNGHKFSFETIHKQNKFQEIIERHIAICQKIMAKHRINNPYRYFDLNGGTGYIKEIDTYGGAYRFAESANESKLNYTGDIFEIKENHIDPLKQSLEMFPNMVIHHRDHNDIVSMMDNVKPEWGMGLVYADPYGTKIPIESINSIGVKYKGCDVLMYVSTTTFKRVNSVWNLGGIQEILGDINKKHWYFTKPRSKNQWCFLLGTNWDKFPEYKDIGFYRFDNPSFIDVWEKILYTKKQRDNMKRPKQLSLFDSIKSPSSNGWDSYQKYLKSYEFKAVRRCVMNRANNTCEVCKSRRASEVHHIKYSKWYNGDVDKSSNIIAICHPCHCDIHKKEN